MHAFRTSTMALLAALGFGIIAPVASADHYYSVEDLAVKLKRESRLLSDEIRLHYRGSLEFGHLMADARELERLAIHVRRVAHYENASAHLSRDVSALDRSLHHMEELLAGSDRHRAVCTSRGCRHFHGDTRHVRRLVNDMVGTTHYLKETIERLAQRPRYHRGSRPSYNHGSYPRGTAGYGPRRSTSPYGFTFGNRRFSIGFGSWF